MCSAVHKPEQPFGTEIGTNHWPGMVDVLAKASQEFTKKYGRGKALDAWMEHARRYETMSPREIIEFKKKVIALVTAEQFKQPTIQNRLRRKFTEQVLAFSIPSVLSLSHIGKGLHVFCLTLPLPLYRLYCWATDGSIYQGVAATLGLNGYATLFDRVVISSDNRVGGGMAPEQVMLHEATHCVDIMDQFRKVSERQLLSEIVAVLGEGAIPAKQLDTLVVGQEYFTGYLSEEILKHVPNALKLLLGIPDNQTVDRISMAKKLRLFLISITVQCNNRDLLLLFMHSTSFEEVYTELRSHRPDLFDVSGTFSFKMQHSKP